LVYPKFFKEPLDIESVLQFLKKRVGQLDGVVITGGEPLIYKKIIQLISTIKSMGYAVKIDTNGYFPDMIKTLLNKNLIDYIAMDLKASFENYTAITKKTIDITRIQHSIQIIMTSEINYEFRITLVDQITNVIAMEKIAQTIKGAAKVYLQKSTFPENCNIPKNELHQFKKIIGQQVMECSIR
jgi:pyruvate formate lyase activating enzyme